MPRGSYRQSESAFSEFSELMANDGMLPMQFFERIIWPTPEKRLIAAVFEDTLHVYIKHRTDGDELTGRFYTNWRDAFVWLTDLQYDGVFSLIWCCEALGINATLVAKKICSREPIDSLRHSPTTREHATIRPTPKRRQAKAGAP